MIVNKQLQNRGFGKTVLLWAIHHIRTYTDEPITIHVAEWNQNAIKLYIKNGFIVTKKRKSKLSDKLEFESVKILACY